METAREHIEEIRKKKFSIGGEENPLTEDLHQAVKNLSAELYAKDVHFLMELIQVTLYICLHFCLLAYGLLMIDVIYVYAWRFLTH
jgi:hypothetical protein